MDAAELLWQRDEARARLQPLEAENHRLKMLLGYAEAAIRAEYNLRVHGREVLPLDIHGRSTETPSHQEKP